MYHLDCIGVAVGQQVHAGTVLGDYGDTYVRPCGKHLYVEFDADTRVVGGRGCPGDDGHEWYAPADLDLPGFGKDVCPACGKVL